MIQEKIISDRPHVISGGSDTTDARNIRIFVPIDFSSSSFTALEYALNLAKICNGSIDLFHLTDISTLGESDNPVVINRMLDRLEAKASVQNESLREMIEESGVRVASCESVVGNIEVLLHKKIEELSPDLIVMNKNRFAGQNAATLITKLESPVLVIPDQDTVKLPSNVVLSADLKPVRQRTMDTLLKIVQHTSPDLTVLHIGNRDDRKVPRQWNIQSTELRLVHVVYDHENVENGIASYVKANDIDLLCLVHRQRSWWGRFFQPSVTQSLVGKIDVAILIVRDQLK